jgi:hypothetical protein
MQLQAREHACCQPTGMCTSCGTRTRNLRIRSPTPCPLGQGGMHILSQRNASWSYQDLDYMPDGFLRIRRCLQLRTKPRHAAAGASGKLHVPATRLRLDSVI